MNKIELVVAIAERAEIPKKSIKAAPKAFTETVEQELVKGEKIQFVDFGTFKISERPVREDRNSRADEDMKITVAKTLKLKAGKALKDAVSA